MMSTFSLYPQVGWSRDSGGEESPALTVSDLTAMVKQSIEHGFDRVAVRGEISNLSCPKSGHVYFKLKDASAMLAAVLWKSAMNGVRFELKDGLEVMVWGGLTVYPSKGEYQIVVRKIEPVGVGALELAFRQLSEKLRAAGYFATERKRLLPRFPRRIVLVTSPTGAAVHDFLKVIGNRWPLVEVLIAPAKMQGIESAKEVVSAINLANRVQGAELIVLARGGGSIEDLWTFNEESVARAIYLSRLPIATGIGHEIDVTIADMVADLRANTPTDAAVRVVPDRAEVLEQLISRTSQMNAVLRHELNDARHVVRSRSDALAVALKRRASQAGFELQSRAERIGQAMRVQINRASTRLNVLSDRLPITWTADFERRRIGVARRVERLEALSPLGVLLRGYSLTQRLDGTLIRRAGQVSTGELIRTRLATGELTSRVELIGGAESSVGSSIDVEVI
jgi:exodeoxyribonuclease VII large subunit